MERPETRLVTSNNAATPHLICEDECSDIPRACDRATKKLGLEQE